MPTPKQERLAENIIANARSDNPKSLGAVVVSSGYSPGFAKGGVTRIAEQKGVQEALEARGFTELAAKEVVAELMLDPSQDGNVRLKAADMTFKVHGSYAAERSVQLNVNLEVPENPRAIELAEKYEQELRKSYTDV